VQFLNLSKTRQAGFIFKENGIMVLLGPEKGLEKLKIKN